MPFLPPNQQLMAIFSRTTWVDQHQQGKPFWILLEQEMMGWHWHQLDHMEIICISLDRQITTPVPHHSAFTDRMPFLPPNQQRQSTEGTLYTGTKSCCMLLPATVVRDYELL